MAESITEGTLNQWSKRETLRRIGHDQGLRTRTLTPKQRSATLSSRMKRSLPSRRTRYASYIAVRLPAWADVSRSMFPSMHPRLVPLRNCLSMKGTL
jgi:hypothetical protein